MGCHSVIVGMMYGACGAIEHWFMYFLLTTSSSKDVQIILHSGLLLRQIVISRQHQGTVLLQHVPQFVSPQMQQQC